MPEGDPSASWPSASTVVRRSAGRTQITRDPRLVARFDRRHVVGAVVVGKHLLVRFDDGRTLHAHLRMDGSFVVGPSADRPAWNRRIELWLEDGRLTGVTCRCSACWPPPRVLGDRASRPRPLRTQPPIPTRPCPADGPPRRAARRCTAGPTQRRRLQQRLHDELPSHVGVSPNQPIGRITGLAGLVRLGTALIRVNTTRGPQILRPSARHAGSLGVRAPSMWVCGAAVTRWTDRVSPWRRSSYWCPSCQPMTPDRAVDLDRSTAVSSPCTPPGETPSSTPAATNDESQTPTASSGVESS